MDGCEIASYLVIAVDERDAEARASSIFYEQHPAYQNIDLVPDLTFQVEKRSSARRWDH
jgi:hypothetical protein